MTHQLMRAGTGYALYTEGEADVLHDTFVSYRYEHINKALDLVLSEPISQR